MKKEKTYNPCDDCKYSYSRNNQESGMCKICELEYFKDRLLDARAADVIPKSEVEQLQHKYDLAVAEREANVRGFTEELETLRDTNEHLAVMLMEAKAEGAIEVLREIDYTLSKFHCYEYEKVRRYIPHLLIELKKKYTERET